MTFIICKNDVCHVAIYQYLPFFAFKLINNHF